MIFISDPSCQLQAPTATLFTRSEWSRATDWRGTLCKLYTWHGDNMQVLHTHWSYIPSTQEPWICQIEKSYFTLTDWLQRDSQMVLFTLHCLTFYQISDCGSTTPNRNSITKSFKKCVLQCVSWLQKFRQEKCVSCSNVNWPETSVQTLIDRTWKRPIQRNSVSG